MPSGPGEHPGSLHWLLAARADRRGGWLRGAQWPAPAWRDPVTNQSPLVPADDEVTAGPTAPMRLRICALLRESLSDDGWRGHAPQYHTFPCGRMIYATLPLQREAVRTCRQCPGSTNPLLARPNIRARIARSFRTGLSVRRHSFPLLQCMSYLPYRSVGPERVLRRVPERLRSGVEQRACDDTGRPLRTHLVFWTSQAWMRCRNVHARLRVLPAWSDLERRARAYKHLRVGRPRLVDRGAS